MGIVQQKQIKRINTNIKAIGVKYGKDSLEYQNAVKEVYDVFGTHNDKLFSKSESGYFVIRNTKETQSKADMLTQVEMSSKTSIKRSKERAKKIIEQRGEKATPQRIAEETHAITGLDFVMGNLDYYYELLKATGNEELENALNELRIDGTKEYDELYQIVQNILEKAQKAEEMLKQSNYNLAKAREESAKNGTLWT